MRSKKRTLDGSSCTGVRGAASGSHREKAGSGKSDGDGDSASDDPSVASESERRALNDVFRRRGGLARSGDDPMPSSERLLPRGRRGVHETRGATSSMERPERIGQGVCGQPRRRRTVRVAGCCVGRRRGRGGIVLRDAWVYHQGEQTGQQSDAALDSRQEKGRNASGWETIEEEPWARTEPTDA
jgi:hypothetical protein